MILMWIDFFLPTPTLPLSSSLSDISGRSRAVDNDSCWEMSGSVAALLGPTSREVSTPQAPLRDPQLQQQRAIELELRGQSEIWNRSTVKTSNWLFYNLILQQGSVIQSLQVDVFSAASKRLFPLSSASDLTVLVCFGWTAGASPVNAKVCDWVIKL